MDLGVWALMYGVLGDAVDSEGYMEAWDYVFCFSVLWVLGKFNLRSRACESQPLFVQLVSAATE